MLSSMDICREVGLPHSTFWRYVREDVFLAADGVKVGSGASLQFDDDELRVVRATLAWQRAVHQSRSQRKGNDYQLMRLVAAMARAATTTEPYVVMQGGAVWRATEEAAIFAVTHSEGEATTLVPTGR